jgi:dolichol-phosphate mannosyltransferase
LIIVLNGHEAKLTPAMIDCLTQCSHTVIVVKLAHRYTQEVASFVGTEYAKGDYILELDRLTALDTATVKQLFNSLKNGHDIVSLVPQTNSSLLSGVFYSLLNTHTVASYSFGTEYGRLVTRRAVNAMMQLKHRTKYRKLLYAYTGFARDQVALVNSKLTTRETSAVHKIQLAGDVLITFTNVVLKTTMLLSLAFMLISAAGGLYALAVYLQTNTVIEGWTTLMLFVSFGLSGVFLILGMVVKYLELILRETQSAPLYVVNSVDVISQGKFHSHV